MKKFGYYLVFASLAASLAFMSCNDEGRNNNNGNGNGNGGTDENNVYLKNPPKNGDVYVCGERCMMRGKKIKPGDTVRFCNDVLIVRQAVAGTFASPVAEHVSKTDAESCVESGAAV